MKYSRMTPLLRSVRSIPDPVNYFSGVSASNDVFPSQVILFCRHSDKLSHPPKSHTSRHILIINLSGGGVVVINNLPMQLTPGNALMILPHNFHHYMQLDQRKELIWLFVSFELADSHLLMTIKNTPISMSNDAIFYTEKLVAAYLRPDRFAPIITNQISTLLWLLLMNLVDSYGTETNVATPSPPLHALQSDYELVERIETYIAEHIEDPIHIRDIARYIHLSESRVATVFKKMEGYSLGYTIRRLRIYHACQIMQSTNVNLSQIADRLGFDNIYAFSRSFKTIIGIAPSVYRKKMAHSQLSMG